MVNHSILLTDKIPRGQKPGGNGAIAYLRPVLRANNQRLKIGTADCWRENRQASGGNGSAPQQQAIALHEPPKANPKEDADRLQALSGVLQFM